MRLDNLDLTRHFDHGTFFFHGAISFCFGGGNVNHVALLVLVAVRLFNSVGNLDGVAFGFAVRNIDDLSGWNFDIDAFLDWLTVGFFDNVGYLNNSAFGNLDINANGLGARNLGGDTLGDIFANLLGDLCTDRPLSPATCLFRRTGMTFINHDGFANINNLGFYLVFHDSGFTTFRFSDGSTLCFWPGFGDIPEALLAFCGAFFIHIEIGDLFGDFRADFLAFFIIPKRQKLKNTIL